MLSPAERDVVRGSLRRLPATSPDTNVEGLVAAATWLEVAEGEVLVTEGGQSVETAWRKWRALASELAGATGAAPTQPRRHGRPRSRMWSA